MTARLIDVAKIWAVRGGVGVSLFLLVFVAYAHVVSIRDAGQSLAAARDVRLSSPGALDHEFSTRAMRDFKSGVEGDSLHVVSSGSAADAEASWIGKETRLVDSRLRARFRWNSAARASFGIGVETVTNERHAISVRLDREGDACTLRLVGDAHALGPVVSGTPVIAESAPLPCDAEWHEIELHFCPDLMRVIASIDGIASLSPLVSWDRMTLVRPGFSVHALAADAGADVSISEVDWDPDPIDLGATDVDDSFDGKIIDPLWRIARASPALAETTFMTGPGGLAVTAHSHSHDPNLSVITFDTPSSALKSLRATIELDVAKLRHGAFAIGLQNEPGPAWRFADTGVLSLNDGKLVPFEAGHFDENGQSRFRAWPELAHASGKVALSIFYDAKTRRLHAMIDDTQFLDEHLDLPPRSLARFRFGLNLDFDGEAVFTVKHLRIDHL